jgi:Na+/proline symporter
MIPNYFIVMLAVVLIGLVGIVRLHDLKAIEADQVLGLLLAQHGGSWYWLTMLVFLGAAAAIMSTAAGVLLTLSSMLTHDLYRHFMRPRASERELATVGRLFTVLVLVSVTVLSLRPLTTLWNLTIIKFEFLMQLYVPLILGLYWSRFSRAAAFAGLGAGTLCVSVMIFLGPDHVGVFEAGLCGALVNLLCGVGVVFYKQVDETEQQRVYERFFSLFHATATGEESQPRSIVLPLSSAPE